ncbi:SAVED domain-containing protein [Arthrobacter crystallopoietes]|uniref:SAVED domain-containing protein n=1 Tax=Crystallibacter crystallopoietes TaxID=37928 RepID=UPI0014868018|nr:SAVED domain-containing protein [Arthrobacter crystallopoietes]
MTEELNTAIARSSIPDSVRERIWGRAAARCVLCSDWLIDSTEFWHSIPTGEIAHNVGATSGPNSPRGKSTLTAEERAQEANLFLVCRGCHKKIDSLQHRDSYSVEFLTSKKNEHEERVRQVTDFATLRPATVLRVVATVRGTYSPIPAVQISEALRREGLTGMGADTRNGVFDISLPDPESASWSWARAKELVNKTVDRVLDAVAAEDIQVLSVFAIAPVPVLIYLGSRLDDKTETALFPRQRKDGWDSWAWTAADSAATVPAFIAEQVIARDVACASNTVEEVVVLVSLSARVSCERIPDALDGMPIWELRPETLTPSPDLIDSPAALGAFGETWRGALSLLEATYPKARRIHLIAAVPITAAVSLGRHHMRDAQPELVLYQRNHEGSYDAVLEVTR